MKSESRRWSGWGGALLVAAVLAAGAGAAVRARAHAPALDLNGLAAQVQSRIHQALSAQARALEPRATAAGQIRELQAALDMGADRATCQDLLDNEEWWSTYRASFPLSAVIVDGPLAVVGPGSVGLAESDLVRGARQRGVSSGLLPGVGRAFVAAAARVTLAQRPGSTPVVVVAKLLDGVALKAVSDLTGDVVGVSDGTKLLDAAGPDGPGRVLGPLLGREASGPVPLEEGRVGTAWPVGGGLWLLAAFTAPPAPPPPPNWGLRLVLVGGILAAAGFVMLLMGRRVGAAAAGADPSAPSAQGDGIVAFPASPGASAGVGGGSGASPRDPGGQPARPSSSPGVEGIDGGLAGAGTGSVAHARSSAAIQGADSPGTMGRYELIERIGEGGMAEIFFAAARGAENFVRYFVVKRMHPQLARNQDAVNQFIDEGRLQAGLVHSNIVPVFDFGKAAGEYFLALEYIHGKDLGQIVQRHMDQFARPLDVGLAFYVVHDVLEALSYAHAQVAKDGTPMDIVHRDVSPGNVLVSYRGEVKLTDFGIAKADRRVSRTEVGMVKGNASFMSPEQARGETVDLRSDVFSAGLVLFYCLTNQFLYRGETTLNRLLRAAVGPATSQFDQIDQLPLAAAKVLRRALALDPASRYPNAAAFARDLNAGMSGRSQMTQLMDELFPASLRRDLR